MNTIYIPSGKAKEYGDYALNIYQGCPHGCVYCFAPAVLKRDKIAFHGNFAPRANIVEESAKRLAKGDIKGKHIHLCFTCDPFPYGQDHAVTREIIRLIHDSGNYVQILTKGSMPEKDWDCLNENDIYGITISCWNELAKIVETNTAVPSLRLLTLMGIKRRIGCKTFVSCEPVFEVQTIYGLITGDYGIDEYKIGKLNYMSKDNPLYPNINWGEFGRECERLCKEYGRKYYIKDGLRAEM